MQRQWIGRTQGYELQFKLHQRETIKPITVFTTRPETIFGASYIAVALDHPLVQHAAAGAEAGKGFPLC
jgi:leucyl-tRNA synthetase